MSLSQGSAWLQLLESPTSLLYMMSTVINSGRDMLSNQPLQPREIARKVRFVFWEGLLENIFEWRWRLEHLLLGRESLRRRWELQSCVGPPGWHWGVNVKNHWEMRKESCLVLGKTDVLIQPQWTKHLDFSFCKPVYSCLKEIIVGVFYHLQAK